MSVTAGRPTEVRDAAVATLADLDRELRAVETERERAAAVAWLEEAFDAFLTSRIPGRFRQMTPGQVKLAEAYAKHVSRASNYPRPMAAVLNVPGIEYIDGEGRNVFVEEPAEDAAHWPEPASGCELSDADDFRDGMTPTERRNDAAERRAAAVREQAAQYRAAAQAPARHIDLTGVALSSFDPSRRDLTGRPADATILDDPMGWRPLPQVETVRTGQRSPVEEPTVLERFRDALASPETSEDVALEMRDDAATNDRRVRITLDGRRWHELTWAEGSIAYSLMQDAARRRNAPSYHVPPPPPPPARFRWAAPLSPSPELEATSRRMNAWVAEIADRADVNEAIEELAVLLGPALRRFEREHVRRQLAALERVERRRVLHLILDRFVHPGRPVDWSTIVDDVRRGRPHRPGRPLPADESFGEYQDRTAAQDRVRELMRRWPERIRTEHANCRAERVPLEWAPSAETRGRDADGEYVEVTFTAASAEPATPTDEETRP